MTEATGTLIEKLFGAHAASAPRRRGGVVAARQPLPLNTYDARPILQSLFDLGATGGLTRRCFLGRSVVAAVFLSGCITAGRNRLVGKTATKAEARITELKLALPPPTQPSATVRPAVMVGKLIFEVE